MTGMDTDHYKIGGMGSDIYKIGGMGDDEYRIGPAAKPTHGKLGAIYRQRPNGFKGSGLNDATWGTGFAGSASRYYEVVIDAVSSPDTVKWRANGGSWTSGVAITGAAQTLDNSQTITFAATTGHTVDDQWIIGNFKDEPCTESATVAQITDSTKRILNANSLPTFTDSGGADVLIIDPTRGRATFSANVAAVDVDGNNGFIVRSGLEQMGYLIDWTGNFNVAMADASRMGQQWREQLPGQGGGSGSANSYFLGNKSLITELIDNADTSQNWFFLELFTYDPAQDQSGDHLLCWVTFTGLNVNALGEVVKEPVTFDLHAMPSFVGND